MYHVSRMLTPMCAQQCPQYKQNRHPPIKTLLHSATSGQKLQGNCQFKLGCAQRFVHNVQVNLDIMMRQQISGLNFDLLLNNSSDIKW